MRQLKGISPLIASVLLVGFTLAIAAVVVVWITNFSQQQAETIGQRGEQQTFCAFSTLFLDKDDVSVLPNSTTGDGSRFNITVTYSSGTETLNITGVTFRDANGVTYVNITAPNLDATVKNMGVGTSIKLTNYILSGVVPPGVTWKEVKVIAVCQNRYTIIGSLTNV